MNTSSTFWDKISRKYAARPVSNIPAYEQTLERVQSYLGEGDTVLEVGGGTGSTALTLAPCAARYVGSDFSKGMIDIANEKLAKTDIANLEFRCAGLGQGDFDGQSFDAVLGFNLFHLIPDAPAAMREIHGLLTPGGLFISKTPCVAKLWYLRPAIKVMQWIGKAPFLRFYTFDGLERDIRSAGFEIIETGNFPAISRFVVARKL